MPSTTASKALLELNGLVLKKYCSIYGYACEVLTADGKHRICFGDDEETVLRKAVEYLEAKAVLTGKPMRRVQTSVHVDTAIRALQAKYEAQQLDMKRKLELEKARQDVFNQLMFSPYGAKLSGGPRLLDPRAVAGFDLSGPEPEKKE